MEFLQDLFKNAKELVIPRPKLRTWDFGNDDVGLSLLEASVSSPLSPPPAAGAAKRNIYETDEQANRTFLAKYWLYMTNHYGRAPQYRTDLFCCMMPMDVMNPELDRDFPIRYWWMSLKHPLVHILHNNGAEAEQELDSVVFGIGLVYRDEYVEQVMDWLVDLCEQDGNKALQADVKSAFAKDRDRVRPIIIEDDDDDENDGGGNDSMIATEEMPPTIVLNGSNSFVTSKKDD